jgi:hypothetical protein
MMAQRAIRGGRTYGRNRLLPRKLWRLHVWDGRPSGTAQARQSGAASQSLHRRERPHSPSAKPGVSWGPRKQRPKKPPRIEWPFAEQSRQLNVRPTVSANDASWPDPLPPVEPSSLQRQVSESSSRSVRPLSDNESAFTAVGSLTLSRLLVACEPDTPR